jgi:hypothetical protein
MDRMAHLYERLAAFNIDKKYVRAIALPAGWKDDDADKNPAVYSQALSLLSRHLNLDLRTLQDDHAPLAWQDCGPTRFKHRANLQVEDLNLARCLAARAAHIAFDGIDTPIRALSLHGEVVRDAILQTGLSWVTLAALLDYCWNSGIPVLHVSRLPEHAKKPDAFAGLLGGRPAIVICKKHKSAAWLLFLLAHELGHIARKHMGEGGLLVDARVNPEDHDLQEEEANTFALELLTGKPDIKYQARFNLDAEELAQMARMAGQRDGVDPGVIALNYARNRGHYQAGNLALSIIELNADPVGLIRTKMCQRLNWQEMPRESRQFLRRITETDAMR